VKLVPAVVTTVVLGVPLAGCGSLGPDASAAVEVAREAHRAGNPAEAAQSCRLLAPDVLAELAPEPGDSCGAALQAESPSMPGAVTDTNVYGKSAQVVFEHDVVFLAAFGDEWKVTAMLCTPVPERPYDCTIKGS
jgi:hypothetical protein